MKSLHGKSVYWSVFGKRYFVSCALLALIVSSCGGNTDEFVSSQQSFLIGDSLPGLSAQQALDFAAGRVAFLEEEGLADGLGPVFNEKSCANCHSVGAVGGAGAQFERRAGKTVSGKFDSLGSEGGQLFDLFSVNSLGPTDRAQIPGCTLPASGEPIPGDATVSTLRRTTALFGLGFVDATPDGTFDAIRAMQPSSIKGHVNRVLNIATHMQAVGKFGWKAQVPTLHQFSGDAYLNEMGITNPEFPNEQAPLGNAALAPPCDLVSGLEDDGEDVELFTAFMLGLAPVPPLAATPQSQAGDALFTQIGCDGCHVRTITAGSSPIAAIDHQAYHPFSDFLLHDMGTLGDGIGDTGKAQAAEMRTAPLWGVRFVAAQGVLLHDGSASTFAAAILRHDGQGAAARNAFAALSPADQNKVIAFLGTL